MKVGRNNPCPCGSGKKHKHCCASKPAMEPGRTPAVNLPLKVKRTRPAANAQVRPCESCTACCFALIINEPGLVLPGRNPCPNLCDRGCAIHDGPMPDTCKGYLCAYAVSSMRLSSGERPDQVGAIVREAYDNELKPPMNRTICISECAPGGMARTLANRVWRPMVREALLAGNPVLFSWLDDPQNREAINVCYFDGKLGCELTCCHPDGSPVIQIVQPVYDQPIHNTQLIPNQGFVLDARLLISQLGDDDWVVIGSSSSNAESGLRFLFTRNQARLLDTLLKLPETPNDAAAARRTEDRRVPQVV